MISWLRQHGSALGAAISSLGRAPGGFLFNVLVVAIALALPFMGLTLLDNVRPMSEQLSVDPEISVFLRQDVGREQASAMATPLRQIVAAHKAKIIFNPREQALEALKARSGLADVVATLGENPLPDSWVIRLESFRDARDAASIDQFAEQIRALPGVDTVQVDSNWVKRLAALMHILRLVLILLAATLATVVVAVVFNTIRLQVLTQHEEIAVARLLGATDTYINRPFFYTGALLGLCAGLLALGAVALALQPLNTAIADFARLYASEFQLSLPGALGLAAMLAASAGLGLLGAMLSVRYHLARLD